MLSPENDDLLRPIDPIDHVDLIEALNGFRAVRKQIVCVEWLRALLDHLRACAVLFWGSLWYFGDLSNIGDVLLSHGGHRLRRFLDLNLADLHWRGFRELLEHRHKSSRLFKASLVSDLAKLGGSSVWRHGRSTA